MTKRFTSIWNEKKPVSASIRTGGRPVTGAPRGRAGVASGSADSESGDDGDDSVGRSLRALKVMLDRGLMTEREYEDRKAALRADAAGKPPGAG
ncbi:hypothetical protein N825_28360 [Skermanella stibiiresistens SB22]|uniref:SHOCT domain-containing protein n=1 Tax=Skermanella stibiiresistens SB22 TaxID=1385369 RepID=W9H5L6_9PROT|nr:SHOCT domain-containing protein [Skermanella stibiiresistens]EWY41530.1 hypothetical protein N825_28360 [Skermanella stibiiresistens SB22]